MAEACSQPCRVTEDIAGSRPRPCESWNLKALVGDDTFSSFKRTFLPQGKGRPPDPPCVPLTIKLLLQLELLKQEGNKTNKDVAEWFIRLFPDVSYPSSRLGAVLSRLLKKTEIIFHEGGDGHSFLETPVDLDVVSTALSKLNLKRGELLREVTEVKLKSTEPITHEVIADIENFRSKEGLKEMFSVKWVKQLTDCQESDKDLLASIKQMMQAYRTLMKKKGGVHDQKLSVFMSTLFVVHCTVRTPNSTSSQADEVNRMFQKTKKEVLRLQGEVDKKVAETAVLRETVSDLGKEAINLREAAQESDQQRQTVLDLQQIVCQQTRTFRHLQPLRFQRLKEKVRTLRNIQRKSQHDLVEARTALTEEQLQSNQMKESFLRDLKRQNKKVSESDDTIARLHEQIQHLNEELAVANGEFTIQTRVRNQGDRFSDNVRKTVLSLHADANVPASKCFCVIKIVSEGLFNYHFGEKDLPTTQTVLNISDEGQVLSNIQVAEKLQASENATLHTDGTSRDHKKFVSQQITLDSGETLSLGFQTVPTEDATTLLDVTVNQLGQVSELFSEYSAEEQEEVFRKILQKITSLMSDRAAVMKKFNADFLSFVKTQIGQETVVHFLYCNAHFLLGLSRSCETQLREVERQLVEQSQPSKKLGRDQYGKYVRFQSGEAASSRLIRLASDLVGPRGDEKNGCRQDWLAFCEQEGQKSRMTNYKSNRFNSFFEGAAAVIHHHADLCTFVSSLGHSNLKIESVAADLDDLRLVAVVCAVALVFVRITGPYWELLQSEVKYTEFHKYIQLMIHRMDRQLDGRFQHSPGPSLSGEFELQGDKAALKDSIYNFASQHIEAVQCTLQQLMPDMRSVLRRQLKDFLEDGVYGGQPVPFPDVLNHCPLTNLLGENIFGDLDYDINKRRNASVHQRSSTNMLSHNRTTLWLKKKLETQSRHLLAFARRKGKSLRHHNRQQEKAVLLRLRQRLLENKAKKAAKEARQAATKTELIRKLTAVGGPCVIAEDVDALVIRLRREKNSTLLNALKDQIRYQKTVLNQKGCLRLTGRIEGLTASLKAHLGGTNLPPPDED